ncbi:MAG: DUF1080 domain-containing protein [Agriterribacter sp.]
MEQDIIFFEKLQDFNETQVAIPELSNCISNTIHSSNLENVFIGDAAFYEIENGSILSAYIGISDNTLIDIPNLSLLEIKLGHPELELAVSKFSFVFLNVSSIPFWKLSLTKLFISIVFDENILRRVDTIGSTGNGASLSFTSGISIDSNFKISFSPVDISLERSYIGPTKFIISADRVRFNLNPNNPQITLKNLKFEPPTDLFDSSIGIPAIEIREAIINKDGFSGTVLAEWNLKYDNGKFLIDVDQPDGSIVSKESNLFGIPGGINYFCIEFDRNIPVAVDIKGLIRIPFFNQDISVRIILDGNDKFKIALDTLGNGLVLTKEELLTLSLNSFSIDQISNTLSLSGSLQPLLFAKDGLKWPKMDVRNLRIDTAGKISFDEAWMDLKEITNLDLWGFHLELRKLGMGKSIDERMWLDLSGSIRLVEQLPLGLDMDGFRISWPTNINLTNPATLVQQLQKIQIQFRGIDINFAIPKTVKIDGLIRFFKDAQKVGFAGDMKLAVIPAGFTAEAGMMIGMNTKTPAFPFVYVYFGFESTAGIPLAQTGLALKGAMGLIGINVAPNKKEEADWYYDWYKGAPAPGAHQTTKWEPALGGFAIGIGVTISTVDGVVKKTRGLLVLSFPGPILIINGAAFLLDTGTGSGEPPFTATAIFADSSIKFNLEAQAEIVKDMVEASADVEAFFDFNDTTNWHLYLGFDKPEERRVRANVLNIFKADAYLMLDMIDADSPRIRAGVFIDIEPDIPDLTVKSPIGDGGDLVKIEIDAWLNIDGTGQVSINPEQFSGKVAIDGGLTVSAFGFTFGPTVTANLSIDGPIPFHLKGDLDFTLKMWPEDYHNSAEIDFEADFRKKTRKVPGLTIINPVQSISPFCRFKDESKMLPLYGDNKKDLPVEHPEENEQNALSEKTVCELSPIVPVDSNPVIAFNQSMNNDTANVNMKFMMHPGGTKKYKVGKIELTPTLKNVEIFRKKKSEPWDSKWELIYATDDKTSLQRRYEDAYKINLLGDLWGAWLAEADPQGPAEPGSRRLQLLADSPLIHTAPSYTMEGAPFFSAQTRNNHLSAQLLEDYPKLIFGPAEQNNQRCVRFTIAPGTIVRSDNNGELEFQHILFRSESGIEINGCANKQPNDVCNCLKSKSTVYIYFPGEVENFEITYCEGIKAKDEDKIKDAELNVGNKKTTGKPEKNNTNIDENQKKILTETITFFDQDNIEIDTQSINKNSKNDYNNPNRAVKWIRIIANALSIKEICYTLKQEIVMPATMPTEDFKKILDPGFYYKIKIDCQVEGSINIAPKNIHNPLSYLPGQPDDFDLNGPFREQYTKAMNSAMPSDRLYQTVTYFQTSSPPNNLPAYVKWTYPNLEMNRAYLDDDLLICFNRSYLEALFDGRSQELQNFKMTAFVMDANNNIYPQEIKWERSGSSTRFQDEETWDAYIADRDKVSTIYNQDNLIIINKEGTKGLPANQRCNLIITGGDGGKSLIPSLLKPDEMNKYWRDYTVDWNYQNGILSPKNATEALLTTVNKDYENFELSFEVKGSNFELIFRADPTGGNQMYYKLTVNNGSKIKIGLFNSASSLFNDTASNSIDLNDGKPDWQTNAWQKFKIRVTGNQLCIFLGNIKLVDRYDITELHLKKETSDIPAIRNVLSLKYNYALSGTISISTTRSHFRNIELQDAELLRIPFYTTGFNNRKSLLNSIFAEGNNINMIEAPSDYKDILEKAKSKQVELLQNLGSARLDFYLVQKDYEYNMARYPLNNEPQFYSREAVEQFSLQLRAKEQELDAFFKETLLLNLFPQQMFVITEKGVSVSFLYKKTQTGEMIYALYLQSKEKMYPKTKFETKDPYALSRFSVSIKGNNIMEDNGLIYNSDGDQVLIILKPFEITKQNKDESLEIEINVCLNNADYASSNFFSDMDVNGHHRYDRAFIKYNNAGNAAKFEPLKVKIPFKSLSQ